MDRETDWFSANGIYEIRDSIGRAVGIVHLSAVQFQESIDSFVDTDCNTLPHELGFVVGEAVDPCVGEQDVRSNGDGVDGEG